MDIEPSKCSWGSVRGGASSAAQTRRKTTETTPWLWVRECTCHLRSICRDCPQQQQYVHSQTQRGKVQSDRETPHRAAAAAVYIYIQRWSSPSSTPSLTVWDEDRRFVLAHWKAKAVVLDSLLMCLLLRTGIIVHAAEQRKEPP